jgi:hypothetical protein
LASDVAIARPSSSRASCLLAAKKAAQFFGRLSRWCSRCRTFLRPLVEVVQPVPDVRQGRVDVQDGVREVSVGHAAQPATLP